MHLPSDVRDYQRQQLLSAERQAWPRGSKNANEERRSWSCVPAESIASHRNRTPNTLCSSRCSVGATTPNTEAEPWVAAVLSEGFTISRQVRRAWRRVKVCALHSSHTTTCVCDVVPARPHRLERYLNLGSLKQGSPQAQRFLFCMRPCQQRPS